MVFLDFIIELFSNTSITQPFIETFLPDGVFGHSSLIFTIPSRSSSYSHPSDDTFAPLFDDGHLSCISATPSLSLSSTFGLQP